MKKILIFLLLWSGVASAQIKVLGEAGNRAPIYFTQDSVGVRGLFSVHGIQGAGASPINGAGTRAFFLPRKSAFRTGYTGGTFTIGGGTLYPVNTDNGWNLDSVGDYSFAGGYSSIAKGSGSFAYGIQNYVTTQNAVALGGGNTVLGLRGIAIGTTNKAYGQNSSAIGDRNEAYGVEAQVFGSQSIARSNGSSAFGTALVANQAQQLVYGTLNDTNVTHPIVIGTGISPTRRTSMSFDTNGRLFLYNLNNQDTALRVLTQTSTGEIQSRLASTLGGGISNLNTLTAGTQTFATGTSGTDFSISSVTSTHTFNIPDAGASARGLVTTGTQTFAGVKTLTSLPVFSAGFQTNSTAIGSNLVVGSGASMATTSDASYLFGGASVIAYRIGMRGSGTASITANHSYGSTIIGRQISAEASTGTHGINANAVVLPHSITNGAGATDIAATFYVAGSPTGITPVTGNYTIYSASGDNRFVGKMQFDTLAGSGVRVVTADANGTLGGSSALFSSGRYTPTGTAGINVSSIGTAYSAHYTQVGNEVSVTGVILVNCTASATNSQFTLTLPNSWLHGNTFGDAEGVATVADLSTRASGFVTSTATSTVTVTFTSVATGQNDIHYKFTFTKTN